MLVAAVRRISAASVFQEVAKLLPVVHERVKRGDVDHAQFRQPRHDILVKSEALEHRKKPGVELGNVLDHNAHLRKLKSSHDEQVRESLEEERLDSGMEPSARTLSSWSKKSGSQLES